MSSKLARRIFQLVTWVFTTANLTGCAFALSPHVRGDKQERAPEARFQKFGDKVESTNLTRQRY